ncbi:unnamed protein product, partial [Ectocarpus sp. 12 AP-2014]
LPKAGLDQPRIDRPGELVESQYVNLRGRTSLAIHECMHTFGCETRVFDQHMALEVVWCTSKRLFSFIAHIFGVSVCSECRGPTYIHRTSNQG